MFEKLRQSLIDVQTIIEKSDISLIGPIILNVPEWNFAGNLWLLSTIGEASIIYHNV